MKKILGKVHHRLKSSELFCKFSQIQDIKETKNESKPNDRPNEGKPINHADESKSLRKTSKRKEESKAWTRRALPDITGKTPMKEVSLILPPLPKPNLQPQLVNVTEKSNGNQKFIHSEPKGLVQVRDESTKTPEKHEAARVQPFDDQIFIHNASDMTENITNTDRNTCKHNTELVNTGMVTKKNLSPMRVSPYRSRAVMMEPLDYENNFEQQDDDHNIHRPSETDSINNQNEYLTSDHSPLVVLRPTPKPVVDAKPTPTEIPWKVKLRPVSKAIESDISSTKKTESCIHKHLRPTNIKRNLVIALEDTELREKTDKICLDEDIDINNLPKREFPDSDEVQIFSNEGEDSKSSDTVNHYAAVKLQVARVNENSSGTEDQNTTIKGQNTTVNEDNPYSADHNRNIKEQSAADDENSSDTVDYNTIIKEENATVNEICINTINTGRKSIDQTKEMVEISRKDESTRSTEHIVGDIANDSGSSIVHTAENALAYIENSKCDGKNTIVYKLSETEYEYVMLLRKMEENGMSREAILHRLDTENATEEIRNIVMDRHVQVQKSPKVRESIDITKGIVNDQGNAMTEISGICQHEEGNVKNKLDNLFAKETNPAEDTDSRVEKYRLMLKRGLHEDQVKHAMRRDGMKESIFDQVLCNAQDKPSSQEPVCVSSACSVLSNEEENIASKYKMMLKIGLLEDQVRHKMKLDNIEEKIIQEVCGSEKAKSPQYKNAISSEEEEIASEYLKMLKYGLHEDQVRHKMTMDNIDRKIIDFVCKTVAKKVTPKRKRDSNLIRLHVETISNPNPNSVWSTAKKRKQDDDQVINICMLEDLFKKKPMLPKQPTKTAENKLNIGLSGKTMQNVGVVLQKFKEFAINELIGIIRDLDSKCQIQEENIELITGLMPTDENDKMLLSNYAGEIDKLSIVETFLLKLFSIPRVEEKIKTIKLMATFKQNCQNLSSRFEVLRCACNDVMKSDRLRDIMIIARDIGNKMNEGNYSGGAEGIKFSSLLKLRETKGNDGKTTVLDFIVARMIENGKQETLNLVDDFPLCAEASRIFITDLVCEKAALESARRVCKTEEVKKREEESDSGKPFTKGLIKLSKFIKDTETDLDELEAFRNKTKNACIVSTSISNCYNVELII
jgi:hypothetical protein